MRNLLWIMVFFAAVASSAGEESGRRGGGGVGSHEVARGETLSSIARQHGVAVAALAVANGMAMDDVLREGRRLVLPMGVDSRLAPEVWEVMTRQVRLDRAGFASGMIDGVEGAFTRLAEKMAAAAGGAVADRDDRPVLHKVMLPPGLDRYVDANLPMDGAAPDFAALTEDRRVILYRTAEELVAERFHTSPNLLRSLNPDIDWSDALAGTRLWVPAVEAFAVEEVMCPQGKPKPVSAPSAVTGKNDLGWRLELRRDKRVLVVWHGTKMLRVFPVTVHPTHPRAGEYRIGRRVVAPPYLRRSTGYDLLPGPRSPVGLFWIPLGEGLGLHGTHDPRSIGRTSSAGCVRLSNRDARILSGLMPSGTLLLVEEKGRKKNNASVARITYDML